MPKFVVISNNEETVQAIVDALKAEGVEAIAVHSLAELPPVLKEVPTNGILLDLITSTRATAQEKLQTNDILQLFPHAKVKVVKNEVRLLGESKSLKQFVQNGTLFKARVIRKCDRPVRYTGVLLSKASDFADAEKAVTLNITDGGCFVYSGNDWQVGEPVWLRFKENDSVVQGVVCWTQPWGNNKKMPGIGIKFEARNNSAE